MSETKVQPTHLRRAAVVYVRQSTAAQVEQNRDLVDKRRDYAEARIPEYWIVDPRTETLTVMALRGAAYVEHGVFPRGARAVSASFDGLTADVSAVFDAAG